MLSVPTVGRQRPSINRGTNHPVEEGGQAIAGDDLIEDEHSLLDDGRLEQRRDLAILLLGEIDPHRRDRVPPPSLLDHDDWRGDGSAKAPAACRLAICRRRSLIRRR